MNLFKKLFTASLLIVALVMSVAVMGKVKVKADLGSTQEEYKTALFGTNYNSKAISAYNESWSATNSGFTVNLENFNNNNNKWDYVKCGSKKNASICTITTASSIDSKIVSVFLTIDAITAENVNSIKLYVADNSSFNNAKSYNVDKSAGKKEIVVTSPINNGYYKLEFDCQKASNGLVTVSKITYNRDIPVSEVSLSETNLELAESANHQLTAVVSPNNAADKSITWTSSNPSVATVSGAGLVTAVSAGSAIITATSNSDNSKKATCNVNVVAAAAVESVSLSENNLSLYIGNKKTLTATVSPNNAPNKSLVWESSNSSIATVSNSGLVTAISAGTTTITATSVADGTKFGSCNVTVNPLPSCLSAFNSLETKSSMIVAYSKNVNYTDTLTRALIGNLTSSYNKWEDVNDTSSAIYSGNSAGGPSGHESIQLRTSFPSGIVSNCSSGLLKKVSVVWNSNTPSNRKIDIYGKNEPYTSSEELYNDNETQGEYIGSIEAGVSTELTIDSEYKYIGILAHDGAVYLDSIAIDWHKDFDYEQIDLRFGIQYDQISSSLYNSLLDEAGDNDNIKFGVAICIKNYRCKKLFTSIYCSCICFN